MTPTRPPHFTSIDYQRIEGRGDRVVVLCDRDRPEGLGELVGQTVDVDGALYLVDRVKPGTKSPVRKGERVVLWVERADIAAKAGR